MADWHPGGLDMTKRLLALTPLPPCRIIDLGAGAGTSVNYLNALGFDACGIDLAKPPGAVSDRIYKGNFLHTAFENESFDAVISECAFFISGCPEEALFEANRILRKNGRLLLADVCFTDYEAHVSTLTRAGFSVLAAEDITSVWKEYYLSCIWNGTDKELCSCSIKKPCRYYLTVCERK